MRLRRGSTMHYVVVQGLCLLLCLAASRGLAQALPAAKGPGAYIAVGGGLSTFQSDYGRQHLSGGLIFAEIQPTWRMGIEVEARSLRRSNAEHLREATYLAGPRVTLRGTGLSPYIKLLAGVGHIDLPFGYARGNFLAFAPGAGLEYNLGDRITVRAIDVEYQHWPGFTFGALSPYGLSTGIAVRLNGLRRIPEKARYR